MLKYLDNDHKKFDMFMDVLEQISKKEILEGQFQYVSGSIDDREENLKDVKLHQGYSIECGLKGGKLSGG